MKHKQIAEKIKKVLIIVPYNVIKNWAIEFDKWFEECKVEKDVLIYADFCSIKANERAGYLRMWQKSGGIMLITINLFGNLINAKPKKGQSKTSTIKDCLLDPGPDMVIIDEGHLVCDFLLVLLYIIYGLYIFVNS